MNNKKISKLTKNHTRSKIINFYDLDDVKAFCPQYNNPCFNMETMPLKHPLHMLICGSTGSGKSNILLNIIKLMDSTFTNIKIFTQDKAEPLYQYLESKIPEPYLEIFEGINSLNEMKFNDLEKGQYLFIFDDMCVEKNQKAIEELFIRGRKMAQGGGISCIYLSQSYFQTPPLIRKQISSLILKKINGKRDINAILKETSIDADKDQLMDMFKYSCKSREDITNFMFIHLSAPEEMRFRKNFDEILDVNDF